MLLPYKTQNLLSCPGIRWRRWQCNATIQHTEWIAGNNIISYTMNKSRHYNEEVAWKMTLTTHSNEREMEEREQRVLVNIFRKIPRKSLFGNLSNDDFSTVRFFSFPFHQRGGKWEISLFHDTKRDQEGNKHWEWLSTCSVSSLLKDSLFFLFSRRWNVGIEWKYHNIVIIIISSCCCCCKQNISHFMIGSDEK